MSEPAQDTAQQTTAAAAPSPAPEAPMKETAPAEDFGAAAMRMLEGQETEKTQPSTQEAGSERTGDNPDQAAADGADGEEAAEVEHTEGGEASDTDAADSGEKAKPEADDAKESPSVVPSVGQKEVLSRFGLSELAENLDDQGRRSLLAGLEEANRQVVQWHQDQVQAAVQDVLRDLASTPEGQRVLAQRGLLPGAPQDDAAGAQDVLAELLPEQFEPESENEKTLVQALKTVGGRYAQLERQITAMRSEIEQHGVREAEAVQGRRITELRETILPELTKRYPQLSEGNALHNVLDEGLAIAAGMAATGRAVSVKDALDKACRLIFADQLQREAVNQSQAKARRARRESGDAPRPTVPQPKPKPPTSFEDAAGGVLDAIVTP